MPTKQKKAQENISLCILTTLANLDSCKPGSLGRPIQKKSFDLFSLENVKTKAEIIFMKGFILASPPRLFFENVQSHV